VLARAFRPALVAVVSPADFDAVVVGAGPAGAVAARTLAGAGASVLLMDRVRFPRWKVCGACLSAGALSQLEQIGLGGVPAALGAVPLTSLVLRARAGVAPVPLRGSMAVSRAALDHALVREACAAGATFWHGAGARLSVHDAATRALTVTRDGVDSTVRARVVVDATGLGRGLNEGRGPTTRARAGARVGLGAEMPACGYPVPAGELHMAVGRAGYVGLVRVEGGALNVAAAIEPASLAAATPEAAVNRVLLDAGLPALPAVAGTWKGTPPLTRDGGDYGAPRLLRLGDAAGYTEPFTGQGISWALADGRAAAALALRALDGWQAALLAEWCRYRGVRRRRSERLCRGLAWGLRRPALVGAAMRLLRVAPVVAAPLVRRAARAPEALGAVAA